jgi:mannose-1-phosphate guanylyltransferase
MTLKKENIIGLIMAGGKGTRFWPESTTLRPKQYLSIFGEKSLLEESCDRFDGLIESKNRYVITVKDQEGLCVKSTQNKIKSIIFEPEGRNTGPCIMLSLASLLSDGVDENSVVVIVPSDHVILNKAGFRDTIFKAAQISSQNNEIVTIGITPSFPHTGFGYIEKGELYKAESFKVSRFKEKPHFELAKEYVSSGKYLWNAGMFVSPIKVLLEEFEKHAPKMFEHFKHLQKDIGDFDKLKLSYSKIPSDSFDYAVLEKTNRISVIPANFDWNDLGSWDALTSVVPETNGNTVVKANGNEFLNSNGNIVYAPNHFVSLVDLKDHIVVVNDKVVLIAPVSSSQEIKNIVGRLKGKREDLL